jgi:hypothetical protein
MCVVITSTVLHVMCATMVTLLVPAFGRDELSRGVLTVLSLLLLLANLTLLLLLLLLRLRLLMRKLILLFLLILVGMLLLLLPVCAVRIRTVLHHAGAGRSRGRFGPHWCSVTLAIVASVQTVPVVGVVVPLCATVVIIVVVIVIVVVVTRSKKWTVEKMRGEAMRPARSGTHSVGAAVTHGQHKVKFMYTMWIQR